MEETKVNLLNNDNFIPPEPQRRLVPPPQQQQPPPPRAQQQVKKAPVVKKKKTPSFMYFVCRRTLLLGSSLYICQIIALSIFCNGFFGLWNIPGPLLYFFSCSRDNFEMLNGTGHPFCYKRCSPLSYLFFKVMLGCNTFLWLYWFIGEWLIKSFDLEIGAELKEGDRQQKVMDRKERAKGIEIGEDRRKNIHHSPEWNQALKGWQERKKLQSKRSKYGLSRRAYSFYALFFLIGTFNFWWVLTVSPKNYYTSEDWGKLKFYEDLLLDFAKLLTKTQTGLYNWLILLVVILEAGLFFCAAATVQWPKPALIRGRANPKYYDQVGVSKKDATLTIKPREFFKDPTGIVNLLDDEHGGLVQDTCLLIACHKSTITEERRATFTRTLQSALVVFPPNAIFVCDNAPIRHPIDRTEDVCLEVSLKHDPTGRSKINYLYVPEGNKSHAMYWATEYWIPELVRRGESPDFLYAMMIDDDVPLPPDLHIPNNTLNRYPDIKAVAYVIEAATETGYDNQLVNCQDLEYKMAGFVKQFQYLGGTTACCHGAIALWRRDVLGSKILWDHDTVFHGEDLYMGLLLHRIQKNYVIAVSASAVVPTFAPERLLILFRQRVTSWDLCAQRKFMTFVREFLSGWVVNNKTWILKPFMAQEVVNIMLDWMRLYLVVGLAVYDIFSLFMCFVVFYAILYFELIIFNYVVLRHRPDLQATKRTLIIFPFYRTLCLLFRLYALLRNIIMYASWRPKNIKISEREETVQDMPPVPPIINPDWQTVWYESSAKGVGEDKVIDLTQALVSTLGISNSVERRRVNVMVQAYMLYIKLLSEDVKLGFPESLSRLDGSSHMQGQNHITLLQKAMETFRSSLKKKIKEMIGEKWDALNDQLIRIMHRWEKSPRTLFYNENLLQLTEDNLRTTVRNNLHIISSITQLVHSTNYPFTHDKVAELKQQVSNITELLQIWMNVDKKRQSTAFALNEILSLLEDIKPQVINGNESLMPSLYSKLDNVERQAKVLNLDGEWRSRILQLCAQYKRDIENRKTRGSFDGGQLE